MDFRPSLNAADLAKYVAAQMSAIAPGVDASERLEVYAGEALTRIYDCFKNVNRKYFRDGNDVVFDHQNSDQWAMYLYLLSNTVHRAGGDTELATRLFLLNKALHSIDVFYSVSLPETFMFVHPLGTIIGNAKYGNYFAIYQNCTVGSTEQGYPTFSDGTILYARSMILGGCKVGADVVFAANSFVIDADVPANSTVVGQYPAHRILANDRSVAERIFGA